MNKKIIAIAVAAGLALPMAAAHAGAEVYGKFHVNMEQSKTNSTLNSLDSRIGFKGKQDLGGLTGTYKAEFKVDIFEKSANGAFLEGRNQYVGLKGGLGEVRIGRHDSPLKKAQGKFDQFGDTRGDLKNAGAQDAENRNSSSIFYTGKFGNVGVMAQVTPGEGDGTDGGSGKGIMDASSFAVTYNAGPLYVAAAVDSYDKKSVAGAQDASMTRLVATYKVSDMQFGLLTQSGVEAPVANTTAKETWLGASFGMKVGKGKIKAQMLETKDNAASKTTTTLTSIGYDYKLGKKGTVYAMYNTKKATGSDAVNHTSVGYILKF